jgi:hypothetical protein
MTPKTKPKGELARAVARALRRAARQARIVARRYGTPIHVQSNGTVVALKP